MDAYNQNFYRFHQQAARSAAREIVPLLLEIIRPASVVDVGCGTGSWLATFLAHGVNEVWGIDGPWVDQDQLEIPRARFQEADLRRPLRMDRQFDLAMSLEVAEHLPADCADSFVELLTRLGPVILFSAAIPAQGGTEHLNEQWPDYWARRFAARGFAAVDCLRRQVWENPNVAWWYAQNAVLFVRSDRRSSLLREPVPRETRLPSLVHPTRYEELVDENRHLKRGLLFSETVAQVVPPQSAFILVDDEVLRPHLSGARAIPFLERDGSYHGRPADAAVALAELDRLRRAGTRYLVVAWPAFWWLEHYRQFREHLESHTRVLVRNDAAVIFDLQTDPT